MMNNTVLRILSAVVVVALCLGVRIAETEAAQRAPSYKAALEQAKQTGADIVVFQRGSDWSHLGEFLYANVWNKPEFLDAVGGNAILVAVDNPEMPGNPPVSGIAPTDAQPTYGRGPASPLQRLRDLSDENAQTPANEITRISCANGTVFHKRAGGAFRAAGPNPDQEVLTLALKPAAPGNVLRIDFPLDDKLPGRGPGRADNGNFGITEVQVAGQKAVAAWGNSTDRNFPASRTIDGIADKPESSWNPQAHDHRPHTLLIVLEKNVPAGKQLMVRLICKSPWGKHNPGCISAAIIDLPTLAADIEAVGRAEREIADNAPFAWRGLCTPRIALMDKAGRPVACDDRPRNDLTPATMAERIHKMQNVRTLRDELWAKAEKESGTAQAESYLDGLLVMGDAIAFEGCYNPIQDKIRAADPKGEAGCSRRLLFPPDVRNVPPFVGDAYKLVDQKKFDEALAKIDAELRHPGNRRLTHENIQRIMNGKFNIYRRWPGHEEQRFDVQREILKFDPTTFWGLGAIGYLAMFNKTPEPVGLCYGWAACHVKAGKNTWNFHLDMAKNFDHAGKYCLRIFNKEGKDGIKIDRVTLLDGDQTLSKAEPAATIAPGGKVEVNLEIPSWPPRNKLSVRVEATAEAGKTDVGGRFEVAPLL